MCPDRAPSGIHVRRQQASESLVTVPRPDALQKLRRNPEHFFKLPHRFAGLVLR
jgi:hypothetical protein